MGSIPVHRMQVYGSHSRYLHLGTARRKALGALKDTCNILRERSKQGWAHSMRKWLQEIGPNSLRSNQGSWTKQEDLRVLPMRQVFTDG